MFLVSNDGAMGSPFGLLSVRTMPAASFWVWFGFLRLAGISASELLPIDAPGRVRSSSISSAWWIPEVSWADSPSALSTGWVQLGT